MEHVFNYLNAPSTVASFQRLCGLFPAKQHCNNTTGFSEQEDSPTNEHTINQNGSSRKRHTDPATITESSDQRSGSSSEEEECGYEVTNTFLYYVFHFAANLGNEIFYITFFPFWFWNIDGYVGRRVCVFWVLFMYIGQATKDIVRWPRPASPPVVRMEKRYALEYGMPSTHAMVGAGIPFTILFFTYERYIFPVEYGLIIAVTWCTLVALSRLYLGMHSVLDVIVGLLYVFSMMPILFPFLDTIDHFMLTHAYSPYICILLPFTLALCYPKLDKWSTARGDTNTILGIGAGISVGHWFSFQYGFMHRCTSPPPYHIIYPTWLWFGQIWSRLVIGVVILFATRAFMKSAVFSVLSVITGLTKTELKAQQNLSVELPSKFITYFSIAFNTVYLAPQIFRILGIERETFFTEI